MPHVLSATLLPSQRTKQKVSSCKAGQYTCALWLFWAPIQFSPPIEKDENRWSIVAEAAAGRKLSFAYFSAKASSLGDFPLPPGVQVVTMKGWQNDNFRTALIIFILPKMLSSPGARLYNGIWVWNASDVRVYDMTLSISESSASWIVKCSVKWIIKMIQDNIWNCEISYDIFEKVIFCYKFCHDKGTVNQLVTDI